jgi:flavin reductase (DIM6/NTAB) family NADH-FMN oxidoreductase RutF
MSNTISFTTANAPASTYHMMNAIVAPRPIAWVSTVAADGTFNVAPHSYTTILSGDPPIIGFVSTGRKDTLINVEKTGEFVYNVAGEQLGERMNRTAADFPPNVSEFDWAGLTPAPSDLIKTPRVGEADISIEAVVRDIYRIPGANSWMVVGEAVAFHINERVIRDGRIDPALVRPLGRLAGFDYATFGEVVSIPRPSYAGLVQSGAQPFERIE